MAARRRSLATSLSSWGEARTGCWPSLTVCGPGGRRAVIETLLNEDAVLPSAKKTGVMSDRGLRRLFDRLIALGAVRELTGRSTFRLYGL
jgi:Protein of unknown function (DUF1403)